MSTLRFLADVNISPKTIAILKDRGYDIIRSTEILPPNARDIEILEVARQDNRIIVTQDLDFSMLVAINGYDQPSLITLRMSVSVPALVAKRLLDVLPMLEAEITAPFAIAINDETVRIRKLPIA